MNKTKEQLALELISDLYQEGCIEYAPNDFYSDYRCRYCHNNAKSDFDHTVVHDSTCMWLKIEQLEKDKS